MVPIKFFVLATALSVETCKGEGAEAGVEVSSLLQTKGSKHDLGIKKCSAANQFCKQAVSTVAQCQKAWKEEETICAKALCNVSEVVSETDVTVYDAGIMRMMCKRYVHSMKWGKEGWTCPSTETIKASHEAGTYTEDLEMKDTFCRKMFSVCDGWAIWFIRKAETFKGDKFKKYCESNFVQVNRDIFKNGPSCDAYEHDFPGFADAADVPSAATTINENTFTWEKITDENGEDGGCDGKWISDNKIKYENHVDHKDNVDVGRCMHICERYVECRAIRWKETEKAKGDKPATGTCKIMEEPCTPDLKDWEVNPKFRSYKLTRFQSEELLQTEKTSARQLETSALQAELEHRAQLTRGSSDEVDQHLDLDYTTMKKCSEPC